VVRKDGDARARRDHQRAGYEGSARNFLDAPDLNAIVRKSPALSRDRFCSVSCEGRGEAQAIHLGAQLPGGTGSRRRLSPETSVQGSFVQMKLSIDDRQMNLSVIRTASIEAPGLHAAGQ
jgi:hypothetical protein